MASKRRLRRKRCGSKVRYASFQEALDKRRTKSESPYKCPFCNWWHTGHFNLKKARDS